MRSPSTIIKGGSTGVARCCDSCELPTGEIVGRDVEANGAAVHPFDVQAAVVSDIQEHRRARRVLPRVTADPVLRRPIDPGEFVLGVGLVGAASRITSKPWARGASACSRTTSR